MAGEDEDTSSLDEHSQAALDREIPEPRWGIPIGRLGKNVWREMGKDGVLGLAAQMSFYFVLSLFPFLLFMAGLVGSLPFLGGWEPVLRWTTTYLPAGSREFVFDTISGLTRGHASFLSIGLLGTLWAASAGLMSLMGSLDIAYDVPETRSFVRQVATCMAMVIVIALFFLGAFGLLTLGDWADRWVQMRFHLDGIFLVFWTIGRQITSLALLWMGLSLLDHVLPNIQRSWSALMPGTLLVVVLIGPITLGMNFYVRHVASYDKTYGTLAGLAILMVWIYLISLMTLVGAEVNCEIWKLRTARQGQPRNNRADDSTHFRSAAA